MRRFVFALSILLLAACSGSSFHASSTTTSVGETTTTLVTEDQNLVPAEHQQCADLGKLVETYFLSGNTGGHPGLDQDYASERAAILGQPSAARAGLARADADNVIQACDKQLDDQAAARQQAAAQAQAQAQAAAQAQAQAAAQQRLDDAENAQYRTTCARHNGKITTTQPDFSGYDAHGADPAGEYCGVTYGADSYLLPITEVGVFDTTAAHANKGDCDNDAKDAQTAAQAGFPWSQLPAWHADTGLCVRGSP